jgi:hypothetical protein
MSFSITSAYSSPLADLDSHVILKNEILLKRDSTNYTEVRHIVLKGTNEQIGKALGEIAQKDYNISLNEYGYPIYAKARLLYMQKNYLPLYERMGGIADAYNISLETTLFDPSSLSYELAPTACSVIYFPPSVTENGHAVSVRNMDSSIVSDFVNGTAYSPNNLTHITKIYILELHPEKEYSSIVMGTRDLLDFPSQGINSEGLAIEVQYDNNLPPCEAPLGGALSSGINRGQIAALVLDTCKDVEEAKVAFLNNRIYFPKVGEHYLIYDKSGNSTVVDFIPQDSSVYFSDATSKIHIMTNHPEAIYPSINFFPKLDNNISYYNSFERFKTLLNITENHKGKYTEQDMVGCLAEVYAELNMESGNAMGITESVPVRTIWNSVLDLTSCTISARFYLRDGPFDKRGSGIIFTRFFNFTLKDI